MPKIKINGLSKYRLLNPVSIILIACLLAFGSTLADPEVTGLQSISAWTHNGATGADQKHQDDDRSRPSAKRVGRLPFK